MSGYIKKETEKKTILFFSQLFFLFWRFLFLEISMTHRDHCNVRRLITLSYFTRVLSASTHYYYYNNNNKKKKPQWKKKAALTIIYIYIYCCAAPEKKDYCILL